MLLSSVDEYKMVNFYSIKKTVVQAKTGKNNIKSRKLKNIMVPFSDTLVTYLKGDFLLSH